jgi:predicted Holliday junction resolvase-like endonuclease
MKKYISLILVGFLLVYVLILHSEIKELRIQVNAHQHWIEWTYKGIH